MKSETVLRFEHVRFTYPGHQTPALDELTLALPRGQRVVILGHNGAGKSSLFLHCNGILRPDAGRVLFHEEPIDYSRRGLLDLRRRIGVVFQDADDQLFSASVLQDLSFGPLNLGLSDAEARRRVYVAAEQCDLRHLLDRPTHALSGGEKARAALAGVLAMDPEVLLVDEPTASLDPLMRRQVFTIFQDLSEQGKTIILATHELELARHWADFIVVMHGGRVIGAGARTQIMADQQLLARIGMDRPWYEPFMASEEYAPANVPCTGQGDS
ncbi:MAG: ABC transporter ATP-binding protein [Anaerolineales bacterium]|nr:ABC transporter ATP-binding protein [Anaerolineales bacterium]